MHEGMELSKKEVRFCNIISVAIIIAALLAGLYIFCNDRSKEAEITDPNEPNEADVKTGLNEITTEECKHLYRVTCCVQGCDCWFCLECGAHSENSVVIDKRKWE